MAEEYQGQIKASQQSGVLQGQINASQQSGVLKESPVFQKCHSEYVDVISDSIVIVHPKETLLEVQQSPCHPKLVHSNSEVQNKSHPNISPDVINISNFSDHIYYSQVSQTTNGRDVVFTDPEAPLLQGETSDAKIRTYSVYPQGIQTMSGSDAVLIDSQSSLSQGKASDEKMRTYPVYPQGSQNITDEDAIYIYPESEPLLQGKDSDGNVRTYSVYPQGNQDEIEGNAVFMYPKSEPVFQRKINAEKIKTYSVCPQNSQNIISNEAPVFVHSKAEPLLQGKDSDVNFRTYSVCPQGSQNKANGDAVLMYSELEPLLQGKNGDGKIRAYSVCPQSNQNIINEGTVFRHPKAEPLLHGKNSNETIRTYSMYPQDSQNRINRDEDFIYPETEPQLQGGDSNAHFRTYSMYAQGSQNMLNGDAVFMYPKSAPPLQRRVNNENIRTYSGPMPLTQDFPNAVQTNGNGIVQMRPQYGFTYPFDSSRNESTYGISCRNCGTSGVIINQPPVICGNFFALPSHQMVTIPGPRPLLNSGPAFPAPAPEVWPSHPFQVQTPSQTRIIKHKGDDCGQEIYQLMPCDDGTYNIKVFEPETRPNRRECKVTRKKTTSLAGKKKQTTKKYQKYKRCKKLLEELKKSAQTLLVPHVVNGCQRMLRSHFRSNSKAIEQTIDGSSKQYAGKRTPHKRVLTVPKDECYEEKDVKTIRTKRCESTDQDSWHMEEEKVVSNLPSFLQESRPYRTASLNQKDLKSHVYQGNEEHPARHNMNLSLGPQFGYDRSSDDENHRSHILKKYYKIWSKEGEQEKVSDIRQQLPLHSSVQNCSQIPPQNKPVVVGVLEQ